MIKYLALFLLSLQAFAGEGTYIKYMVNADTTEISKIKGLALGSQGELSFFDTKTEIGFWNDKRPGAKVSGYFQTGLGIEPTAGAFYANFFQSVGAISNTDAYLGSHFEFFEELGFGIRDRLRKTAIGLSYQHTSDAGLTKVNKGRDTIGVRVQIPF